ncbi:MAG: hypothetical protein PHC70_01465 [Patescibacteria group bacterium]|nr:hypothetical protein [Patescibacteria group bacterium]
MKIGIIGSMQMTERMLELKDKLEAMGHAVVVSKFAPGYVGKTDEEKEVVKLNDKFNHDAIREFWDVMQNTNAVLVANYEKHGIPNYIGGNTLMEIGFAHVLNQKIFLINPIPDIPFYKTEIEAVRPVIINGDLTKIV